MSLLSRFISSAVLPSEFWNINHKHYRLQVYAVLIRDVFYCVNKCCRISYHCCYIIISVLKSLPLIFLNSHLLYSCCILRLSLCIHQSVRRLEGEIASISPIHPSVRSFIRSFLPVLCPFIHYFIHSLLRSIIRMSVRSFIYSCTTLINTNVLSFIYSFVLSLIVVCAHPSIRPFVHSLVRPFIRSFFPYCLHHFIQSFIHLLCITHVGAI